MSRRPNLYTVESPFPVDVLRRVVLPVLKLGRAPESAMAPHLERYCAVLEAADGSLTRSTLAARMEVSHSTLYVLERTVTALLTDPDRLVSIYTRWRNQTLTAWAPYLDVRDGAVLGDLMDQIGRILARETGGHYESWRSVEDLRAMWAPDVDVSGSGDVVSVVPAGAPGGVGGVARNRSAAKASRKGR